MKRKGRRWRPTPPPTGTVGHDSSAGCRGFPVGVAGVKRARVYQISSADDFPQPAAVLAMGSIWRLDDIKEWAQRKGRILNVDALSPDPVRGDDGPGSSTVQREP